MKNIFKENDILYRNKDDVFIIKNTFYHDGIMNEIKNTQDSYDDIHVFNKGKSSDFVKKEKLFNDSSNHFSLYNENIYKLALSIKEAVKEMCSHYDISYSRMSYFISSLYQEQVNSEYWYDTGGIRIPCFSGMAFLDNIESLKVKVGNSEVTVNSGDFIIFEAGHKITYSQNYTNMISFNIAPIAIIKGQYPEKWIPIL
jgi:hypothetical protein